MHRRCYYTKDQMFRHYGGRGITVCTRWNSLAAFYADMGDRPSERHSLERIDNDAGYAPKNCRWAKAEQKRNTRRTRRLTLNGRTMCVSDWARETGIPEPTLRNRLRRKWPIELLLSTATERPFARVRQRNVQPFLKPGGISHTGLYYRLKKGWTLEQALHTPRFAKKPV